MTNAVNDLSKQGRCAKRPDAKRREELRIEHSVPHRTYAKDIDSTLRTDELLALLDDAERVEQALAEYDNGTKDNESVGALMAAILRGSHD